MFAVNQKPVRDRYILPEKEQKKKIRGEKACGIALIHIPLALKLLPTKEKRLNYTQAWRERSSVQLRKAEIDEKKIQQESFMKQQESFTKMLCENTRSGQQRQQE